MPTLRGSAPSFLLLAGLLSGCGSPPSVRYLVTISPSNPRSVLVTAEWEGVPHDSLVLGGFESTEVLKISEFSALDESGAARSVLPETGTFLAEGRKLSVPRYVVRGPLPSRIRIRYRVDPDVREGDPHVGFSGVRYGYLGPNFGLITGRNLFLLPAEPGQIPRDIRVRFSLPAGWRVVTPWRRAGDGFRPGIGGRFADEDLIASTLAFGRFSERSISVGRTRYRFAYETAHPGAADDSAIGSLERATRTVRALFGRDLGREYVTVILPATPDGKEIHGEAWAGGQGGTLSPMTPTRLRRYSKGLLEAYLKFSPYRDEISRPEEYWVLDGITNLYAWRAVASAGLVDEEEVERDLASSYAGARHVEGAESDLEKLYRTKLDTELARRVEAPFLLAYLDRLVRERSGGRETLDRVVRNMFRTRPAASLWASISGTEPREWNEFRARYVRGVEAVPAGDLFGLAPAEPDPSPPAGTPVRDLTVIFTGDTNGFLEHCGCKVNQSGGVARRATVLERLRREHPKAPVVDLGNAFTRPEKQTELDYLSREEQRLYLETMAAMRYDASAIGMNELLFGSGWFRDATKGLGIPFVCSNVAERGARLAPASRIVPSEGGLRVAVVSVFEPPQGPGTLPQFEANTTALSIADPVSSLARAVSEVRGQTDLVIVIGRLEPVTIRRVVRMVPGIDMVLSNASGTSSLIRASGTPDAGSDQGFLGKTLVLYEDSRNYGLESVKLLLDAKNRIASAATTHHWLYEDVPDQPRIRAMLNRFYDRVGSRDSAQASVRPLFANSAVRMNGVYVGAAQCAGCHRLEFDQWKTTHHASAYKTLLDAHRHYQPRCVVCHVVGFRTRTGYKLGSPEQPLANVQCEVCHGPGGAHAAEPMAARMERTPPESTCLECHNPQHSDAFVYDEKIRLVRHQAAVAVR